MKKNYQAQLEKFWHNACYAMCIAYVNMDSVVRNDLYYIVMDVVAGWNNGYIEEEGTPEEIFQNPKSERLKQFFKSIL